MKSTETQDIDVVVAGILLAELRGSIRGPRWRVAGYRRLTAALLLVAIPLAIVWRYSMAGESQVLISDAAENHVHLPGQPFSLLLKLEHDSPGTARYHWRDFRGRTLTKPEPLKSDKLTTITAPVGQVGYLGLVLEPVSADLVLPNRNPGETREYGFALLPSQPNMAPPVDRRSSFGMVHADLDDPYQNGWVKTMTWKTTSPEWWGFEMEKRRERGFLELPVVVGAEWASADTQPVSSQQLKQLYSRVWKYFEAHPETSYWELGIEENLRHRYEKPHYWSNLESKVLAVRKAANEVNPDIRLIYQVAELKPSHVEAFLKSAAARHFDILSLHPYAWPDFPDPEQWLDNYLGQVVEIMNRQGLDMPIWFTEAGVPHQGNDPPGFFGYPQKGAEVTGKSLYEAVGYLIKLHVMAFGHGVEKVFWYNYRDREPEREYAENHFGLYDYWGYPKPVYPAYRNLQKLLHGKHAGQPGRLPGNVRTYEFDGEHERVTVVWTHPANDRTLPASILLPDIPVSDIISVVDPMGEQVPVTGASIRISGEPVFIITRLKQQDQGE
jgi:hypothetical protein